MTVAVLVMVASAVALCALAIGGLARLARPATPTLDQWRAPPASWRGTGRRRCGTGRAPLRRPARFRAAWVAPGRRGRTTSQPKGVCVHLTTDNMCEIHATKPQQCRDTFGCEPGRGSSNSDMVLLWQTPEAQALAKDWMGLVGLSESDLRRCT